MANEYLYEKIDYQVVTEQAINSSGVEEWPLHA